MSGTHAEALDEEIARTEDARDWAVKFEQESAARGMAIAEALAYLDVLACDFPKSVPNHETICPRCRLIVILRAAP